MVRRSQQVAPNRNSREICRCTTRAGQRGPAIISIRKTIISQNYYFERETMSFDRRRRDRTTWRMLFRHGFVLWLGVVPKICPLPRMLPRDDVTRETVDFRSVPTVFYCSSRSMFVLILYR